MSLTRRALLRSTAAVAALAAVPALAAIPESEPLVLGPPMTAAEVLQRQQMFYQAWAEASRSFLDTPDVQWFNLRGQA